MTTQPNPETPTPGATFPVAPDKQLPHQRRTPNRCAPRTLRGGLAPNKARVANPGPVRNQWPHHTARARLGFATRLMRDIAGDSALRWSTLPTLLEDGVLQHAKDLATDGLYRRDVRVGASMAAHALQYWSPATLDLTSAHFERTVGNDLGLHRALTPTSLGRIICWGDRFAPRTGMLLDLMHYTHLAGAVLDPWVATKTEILFNAVAKAFPEVPMLGVRLLAPLATTALHMITPGLTHPLGECETCAFRTVAR
jgi:hypothetical protein